MQDDPPPNPAKPLDYASRTDFRKRASPWKWIGLTFIAIVFLLVLMQVIGDLLGRPRPAAQRIESASNLRQIGQVIRLYADDFHGQYPNTLGDLLIEDITPNVFIAPLSTDTPAAGPTTQATAANLSAPGHCSYIYVGKGLTSQTVTSDMVIAYELPAINKDLPGGNVLFGDGHVEFIKMAALNSILTQITAGVRPIHYPLPPAATPTAKP